MKKIYFLLASMLMFTFTSSASIVYTDMVDKTLTTTNSLEFNFDGAGAVEFTITPGSGTTVEPSIFFNTDACFSMVSTTQWDVINGLALNTTINNTSSFENMGGDGYIDPFWGTTMFPTGADTYIGATFKLGANVHFGWIRVNWDGNGTLIAKDFAYENTPNTAINAGDVGSVLVTSITVEGQGNATTITTAGGTLQMNATVLPATATNNSVSWTVTNGTGTATISATGLLTATADGTVTVKATANDASGISGSKTITNSNQNPSVLVTSITVEGQGNATTITTAGGTLQMNATVLPATATNNSVSWTVTNGTGAATISATGLLTATTDGTVTVKATANDASGISGSLEITITKQSVGINELSSTKLSIYPNPATNFITIEMDKTVNLKSANIYTKTGKFIQKINLKKSNKINVQKLNKGIYLLQFIDVEGYIYTKKWQKN